jgi:hypothetical protein
MRILRDDAKKTLFIECESISEMTDFGVKCGQSGRGPKILGKDRCEWTGHEGLTSWDKFAAIFNAPWVKGMNLLAEMQRRVRDLDLPTPTQRKRRRGFNETSGDVDVDRVMRGEYACFSDPMKRDISQPAVLRMVVPVGYSASESPETIAWTCVGVAAVCDLLEASGRMVEMVMATGFHAPYEESHRIKELAIVGMVKEASDPLNVATLVNILSPWFYRSVIFGLQDSQPDLRTSYGRGMPARSGDPLYAQCFEVLGIPENTEMCTVPRITSMEAAESFIRSIVAKIQAG